MGGGRCPALCRGRISCAGDPEAVAARFRIHFKPAPRRPEDYERLMAAMKAAFNRQRKEGILKALAVEDHLMRDTWRVAGYDLLPQLRSLRIPTRVIAGEVDSIPVAIENLWVRGSCLRACPSGR